jgi:hypothetical protein
MIEIGKARSLCENDAHAATRARAMFRPDQPIRVNFVKDRNKPMRDSGAG